ncbi:MAG: M48 family metallopeptidase [Limisphaerales bacterium]
MGRFRQRRPAPVETLPAGSHPVPLLLVRHPRARRYRLRLRADGTARVTIPRGGSAAAARQFVERHRAWLERQWQRLQARPRPPATWQIGSEIWFRGESVRIQSVAPGRIVFGGETLPVADITADLRPAIERRLRQLAARELPLRVGELARRHGFAVNRVMVRNQRTRWGSCSRRGTLSINWRLVQAPDHVRDYIILHELAHLRQMNHSNRFWQEVECLCPDYRTAERWLKLHQELLRQADQVNQALRG